MLKRMALVLLLAFVLEGCGSSDPLDNPSLTSTTANPNDVKIWNSYSAAEKGAYRSAFQLCNSMIDDPTSDSYDPGGAAAYAESHTDSRGLYTARGQGCTDGIAGLPLAGSGIPVPH